MRGVSVSCIYLPHVSFMARLERREEMTTIHRPDYSDVTEFPELVGKTFSAVENDGDYELTFRLPEGGGYRFYHQGDCCETVEIEDICGDLADLVDSPILVAEEISSEGEPAPEHAESYTWTFYRFATVKGTVTVRWLGQSNGYYSESVSFGLL